MFLKYTALALISSDTPYIGLYRSNRRNVLEKARYEMKDAFYVFCERVRTFKVRTDGGGGEAKRNASKVLSLKSGRTLISLLLLRGGIVQGVPCTWNISASPSEF
jgi:hypothetical protein